MHGWVITACVLLALAAYIVWLASAPEISPLVDEEVKAKLVESVPEHGSDGNDVEVFTGFDPMLRAIEKDVAGAQSYVHLMFFKYEDDPVGRALADLLATKVSQGVEVRLMIDSAVNMGRRKLYSYMRERGIQVREFSRLHIPFLRKTDNYRNHRKIVVVDGKVAYVGGMNIAERYGKGLEWGCWRDTQIRIQGPAALDCELAFAMDWSREDAPGTVPELASAKYYPPVQASGSVDVEMLCSGPFGEGPVIMHRICRMLDSARDYAWLESPYLIPTKEIMASVCNAARRGVDVRIIIPPRGDRGVLTPLATKAHVQAFLDAGVKLATYNSGYMHSKTIVSDDRYVTVGSTNIDVRSYILDLEINAFMDDEPLALHMKQIFLQDESESTYIDPKAWPKRSFAEKAAEAFAKLFSFEL